MEIGLRSSERDCLKSSGKKQKYTFMGVGIILLFHVHHDAGICNLHDIFCNRGIHIHQKLAVRSLHPGFRITNNTTSLTSFIYFYFFRSYWRTVTGLGHWVIDYHVGLLAEVFFVFPPPHHITRYLPHLHGCLLPTVDFSLAVSSLFIVELLRSLLPSTVPKHGCRRNSCTETVS